MNCNKCGAEVYGNAEFCENCGASLEQPKVPGENMSLGIVGALVGGAIGVAVILLLSRLGVYAAIGGFALAFCTLKGYELLAKGMSVKGIIVCVAVIAVMPFVADTLDWGFVIMNSFDYDMSYIDAVTLLFPLLEEGAIEMGTYLEPLLTLYGFTALGAVTVVLDAWKKMK